MLLDVTKHAFSPEHKLHLKPSGASPLTATDLSRVLDHLETLDALAFPGEFSMRLTDPDLTVTMTQGVLVADKPSRLDRALATWNAKIDGGCIQTLEGHSSRVAGAAFLSDGTMVTASFDNSIRLWNTMGRCIMRMDHGDDVFCIAVSPDGSTIA
ncbi:WD domain, G-beta repeat [Carpediemonas membranifera]|uniref:WD domain, G-beta repeat n=1 Tax=Carpediemonas membranifera TaxID=201153 RepID=A0A8J6B3X4_9EUKA|nr:WD domain, G-beta repeat [Carpediemonas membranifera]|eukprot:KAG9389517.1 WD domain, G-beta repeat [Carpediemonas membranifera]